MSMVTVTVSTHPAGMCSCYLSENINSLLIYQTLKFCPLGPIN